MPGASYLVYKNLRPPVCIDYAANSPLRTSAARKRTKTALATMRTTKKAVVEHMTDDGRLLDQAWNVRFHVKPSTFNTKNSVFYKVSQWLFPYPHSGV